MPTAHVYHDRKIQGNIKAYRKHILYRQLLLNATNINLNMQQRARAQFAVLYRCYTYNLIHGEYVIGAYLFNVLCLLAKTKQIIHSRKIENEHGGHGYKGYICTFLYIYTRWSKQILYGYA